MYVCYRKAFCTPDCPQVDEFERLAQQSAAAHEPPESLTFPAGSPLAAAQVGTGCGVEARLGSRQPLSCRWCCIRGSFEGLRCRLVSVVLVRACAFGVTKEGEPGSCCTAQPVDRIQALNAHFVTLFNHAP